MAAVRVAHASVTARRSMAPELQAEDKGDANPTGDALAFALVGKSFGGLFGILPIAGLF
jgi:hypothetical protein